MTRSEIRILAFELLYSLEIQKIKNEEQEEQIQIFLEQNEINEEKAIQYIKDSIRGIKKEEENILPIISENLKQKWEIERISKVNLVILKLAIFEIIYSKLPYKIVINEAVEIAKKYGDDNSAYFINGVLAQIVQKLGIE